MARARRREAGASSSWAAAPTSAWARRPSRLDAVLRTGGPLPPRRARAGRPGGHRRGRHDARGARRGAGRATGSGWRSTPPFPGRATVGGVVAANAFGPRRTRFGAARDLVLGVSLVRADGTAARGGGKVVKNVAGFDLPRLMVGSLGTLALLTRVTFRVHPLPETEATVLFPGLDADQVRSLAPAWRAAQLEPSSAVAVFASDRLDLGVRFEGFEAGVADQVARLLEPGGARPGSPASGSTRAGAAAFWARHDAVRERGSLRVKLVGAAVAPRRDGPVLAAAAPRRALAGRGGPLPHAGDRLRLGRAGLGRRGSRPGSGTPGPPSSRPAGSLVICEAPPAIRPAVDPWGPPPPSIDLMRAPQGALRPRPAARARALRGGHLMSGSGRHPALDCVHCGFCLPVCPTWIGLGARARLAARPHRDRPRHARRRRAHGGDGLPPRLLPGLHGLPGRLPVRRPLRRGHRGGPRPGRGVGRPHLAPTPGAARPSSRSSPTRAGCGWRRSSSGSGGSPACAGSPGPSASPGSCPSSAGSTRSPPTSGFGEVTSRLPAATPGGGASARAGGAGGRLRAAGLLPRRERGHAARALRRGVRGGGPAGAGLLRRALRARRARRGGPGHDPRPGRAARGLGRRHLPRQRRRLRLAPEGPGAPLPGRPGLARPRRRLLTEGEGRHRVPGRGGAPGARATPSRPRSPTTPPATWGTPRASRTRRGRCSAPSPGLELVEVAEGDQCCGSAGIYNLVQVAGRRRAGGAQGGQRARHRARPSSPAPTPAARSRSSGCCGRRARRSRPRTPSRSSTRRSRGSRSRDGAGSTARRILPRRRGSYPCHARLPG